MSGCKAYTPSKIICTKKIKVSHAHSKEPKIESSKQKLLGFWVYGLGNLHSKNDLQTELMKYQCSATLD